MYPGECYYCGACVMVCPKDAIELVHPLMNRAKFVLTRKPEESIKKYRESDISDHFPGIFFLKENRPAHQTEQENSVDGAEDFFAADPVPVAEGETTHSSEET